MFGGREWRNNGRRAQFVFMLQYLEKGAFQIIQLTWSRPCPWKCANNLAGGQGKKDGFRNLAPFFKAQVLTNAVYIFSPSKIGLLFRCVIRKKVSWGLKKSDSFMCGSAFFVANAHVQDMHILVGIFRISGCFHKHQRNGPNWPKWPEIKSSAAVF